MITAAKIDEAKPGSLTADGVIQQRCEDALDLLLAHRGNSLLEIEKLLADNPRCVLGHCLRAAIIVCTDGGAARSRLAESIVAIEDECPCADDPARRHAAAARAWLDGDTALAVERYGAIVLEQPQDILALVAAHALDFRLGHRKMLRDRIAQILPKWKIGASGYASLLSMYAFGLEENGQYRRAEKLARRALAIDPNHLGAIHVIAHVMEMQGRAREGLDFLRSTEGAWSGESGFAVHLAWHRGLFHLDANDPASAIAVYDHQIANTGASDLSVLADASALLWRLQLRNIDVGGRWQLLADRWERQSLTGARTFYTAHAIMAFAAAARNIDIAHALQALPYTDMMHASRSLPEDALAPSLCQALVAFARRDYAASIEWLARIRNVASRWGGSVAQCDLIHLTFTEAALRAKKLPLARVLVAERAALKPASLLNRFLQKRLRILPALA